jgi:hypothetical protein
VGALLFFYIAGWALGFGGFGWLTSKTVGKRDCTNDVPCKAEGSSQNFEGETFWQTSFKTVFTLNFYGTFL